MSGDSTYTLTSFARAAGCGCKIAPAVLQEILTASGKDDLFFPNLIAGHEGFEDAAVMKLDDNNALISTTDFFTPIVDNAFDFGRIAAANAISDIYAMGGKPIMALGILGWPIEKLPPALAGKVIEGARSLCKEAGIPLAGGHSIDAGEPFFGLSVNGLVNHSHIKRNHTLEVNDLLFMTKPLGIGILTTALKRNLLEPEAYSIALQWMTRLNKVGENLGKLKGIHAMTDITGFGLLGHLIEMAGNSGKSIELSYAHIPVIEEAKKYLAQRIVPDATYRNWNHYHAQVAFGNGVPVMDAFNLLPDPQTNGGLLIAVAPESYNEVVAVFQEASLHSFIQPVGKVTAEQEKKIIVKAEIF